MHRFLTSFFDSPVIFRHEGIESRNIIYRHTHEGGLWGDRYQSLQVSQPHTPASIVPSICPFVVVQYRYNIHTILFDNINYTSHSHLEIGIVYISSVHSTSLVRSLSLLLSQQYKLALYKPLLTVNTLRGVPYTRRKGLTLVYLYIFFIF